jgi:hypothetical protein
MESFPDIGKIIAAFEQNLSLQAKLELFRGWSEAARFIQDNLVIKSSDKDDKQSEAFRLRGNDHFKKGAFRAALGTEIFFCIALIAIYL